MKRLILALCLWLPALAQFNSTVTVDSAGVLQFPAFFQLNQGTLGLNAILRTNGTAIGTHDFEDITADQITAGALFDSTPFTGGEAENRLAQVGYVKQLAPAIGEDVADLLALPVYAISRWAYLTTDENFWVFCPDDLTADNGTTIRRPTSVASDASPGRWVQITTAGGGGSGTVTSVTLTQPAAGLTITSSGTAITTTGTRTFALANDLAAVEALSGTGYPKRTGTDTWSIAGTVPWSDVASTPTTLSGYGITDAQPLDADLTAIAALTTTSFGRGLLDDADATAARTTLGLGTLATQSGTFSGTSSGNNTGDQTITLTGDVTGSGTGTFATTISAGSVTLADLANLAQDQFIGRVTASTGVPETATITAAARTVLDDATTGAMLTTLGAQPADSDLTTFAGITPSANVITFLGAADYAAMRTQLGLVIGSNVQAYDADLDDLADGSLTGSKVGTGIAAGNISSGVLATARGGTGVDNSTGGTANTFWARPNGATGAATYRAIVAADIPTLNQNTTGSAATLTTARTIYGNSFNGSANLTQIIASTFGGTGNGFTRFSGPTTSEKTFTLPDANATLVDTATAQTLTNKRNTPRVASIAYAASITPNSDTTDVANVGTLTGAITINAPSGTPTDGQLLTFRFTQDGTGRAITWDVAFAFGTDITSALIPVTANAKFEVGVRWNSTDSKWRVVALVRGF